MEFGLQTRTYVEKDGFGGRAAVTTRSSNADINAPDFNGEPISDEDLFLGFILALVAGGRKAKTLKIF